MTAYCDRQSVELNSIAFLFDGRRLRAEQTPDEVDFIFFNYTKFRHILWLQCYVGEGVEFGSDLLQFYILIIVFEPFQLY